MCFIIVPIFKLKPLTAILLNIFKMKAEDTPGRSRSPVRTYQVKRYQPTTCIEKYSYMLIRPPRFLYNEEILNPRRKYKNRFDHQVFEIPFPLSLFWTTPMRYVVLYLHGNSSSRYEGYSHLKHLPPDIGLACFDFNGCGNRTEKQFISLGKSEAEEVDIAVRFLKSKGYRVVLWGRSMGSIGALLSQESTVIVADSPFSSLKTVCRQVAETQVPCVCMCCFHCFFSCFFCCVSADVESKTNMNPGQLQIADRVSKMNVNKSIIFLAGRSDTMINYNHAQVLYDCFNGRNKKLLLFQGSHNSDRPLEILYEVFFFIEKALFPDVQYVTSKKQSTSGRIQKKENQDEVDIGSFQIIKDEKPEKVIELKLSNKFDISSKIAEGGQTEKPDYINQSQRHESIGTVEGP